MRRSVLTAAPGPWFFIALGLLQAVWPLTMDLYLPSFPEVQQSLDTSPSFVQLTLTAAFIGMAAGQLVAGPLSDAVGRTRPLAVALVLYAAAGVGCAIAPSIEVLVGARVLQGLSAAACSVIAISIVRDVASGARMLQLLAHLSVITGFFVVLSPALGAQLLTVLDWRGLFWVLIGYAGLLAVLFFTVFRRRETNPLERRVLRGTARLGTDYGLLFRSRMFPSFVVGGGLIFGGMMTYMSSSAFLFQDVYGLSATGYAMVFGGHGLIMIVGAQVSARLSRRVEPRRIMLIGVAGLVASSGGLFVSVVLFPQAGLLGFLLPLLGFTTFLGLTQPALQASALGPHALRAGTAASLLGASNMIFAAVLSPVPGLFGVQSAVPTVVIMLTCEVAALLIFVTAFRRVGRP